MEPRTQLTSSRMSLQRYSRQTETFDFEAALAHLVLPIESMCETVRAVTLSNLTSTDEFDSVSTPA